MPIVILIIVIVALLAFAWISISNGIVRAANKCDNAWQTIETQLQRRNDLIPNLVETVKGYAAHESGTLEAVTAARGAMSSATTPEAKMEASPTSRPTRTSSSSRPTLRTPRTASATLARATTTWLWTTTMRSRPSPATSWPAAVRPSRASLPRRTRARPRRSASRVFKTRHLQRRTASHSSRSARPLFVAGECACACAGAPRLPGRRRNRGSGSRARPTKWGGRELAGAPRLASAARLPGAPRRRSPRQGGPAS